MGSVIDLRSDTVTRPSEAMRKAMARAEVGDDVYGEDPSVRRLEELAAGVIGKEAALFVPSGTMANQVAIRSLTRAGDVLLAGESAHVLRYEAGAAAALSGLQIQTIGVGGLFTAAELVAAIPAPDVHHAPATAIAFENTHNVSGGRVWPAAQLESAASAARDRGLGVHLDGARLFNASCASGVAPAALAAPADTVAFCLSKGLGAPVGSLVCADAERVREMRRTRKMMGGGMRQAGILAAGGIHALENNVERLAQDHENASRLARGLAAAGFQIDAEPETNIVLLEVPEGRFPNVPDAPSLSKRAREQGVLVNPIDRRRLRAVTHLDVGSREVDLAVERLAKLLA